MENTFYSEAICKTVVENYVKRNRKVVGMTTIAYKYYDEGIKSYSVRFDMPDLKINIYSERNEVFVWFDIGLQISLTDYSVPKQREIYSKVIRWLHTNTLDKQSLPLGVVFYSQANQQ